MKDSLDLIRGTLDALILKALSAGPLHGYGVVDWIRQVTDGVLQVDDGALYTSLHRMLDRGWLEAEWGTTDRGRRAKFYTLTEQGRRRLDQEERTWQLYASAVGKVFSAAPR